MNIDQIFVDGAPTSTYVIIDWRANQHLCKQTFFSFWVALNCAHTTSSATSKVILLPTSKQEDLTFPASTSKITIYSYFFFDSLVFIIFWIDWSTTQYPLWLSTALQG